MSEQEQWTQMTFAEWFWWGLVNPIGLIIFVGAFFFILVIKGLLSSIFVVAVGIVFIGIQSILSVLFGAQKLKCPCGMIHLLDEHIAYDDRNCEDCGRSIPEEFFP